jgi:ribosomal protein S18 acetylase RimI-like enzyme
MASDGLVLQFGLPASWARQVADVYYEAFGAKMRPVLGPAERGVRAVQPDLRLDHVVGAMTGQTLVGLAGLRFDGRHFWQPRVASIVREFGLLGGLPRAAILLLVAAGGEHPGQLHVESLAVRSDWRGRGVGTRLLEACEGIARQRGREALSLDVIDTNPDARRLYERFGFVAVRTRRTPFARVSGFTAITEMVKPLH